MTRGSCTWTGPTPVERNWIRLYQSHGAQTISLYLFDELAGWSLGELDAMLLVQMMFYGSLFVATLGMSKDLNLIARSQIFRRSHGLGVCGICNYKREKQTHW